MASKPAPSSTHRDSEEGSLKIYLREIVQTALLTRKEEIALAKRVRKGDAAARS